MLKAKPRQDRNGGTGRTHRQDTNDSQAGAAPDGHSDPGMMALTLPATEAYIEKRIARLEHAAFVQGVLAGANRKQNRSPVTDEELEQLWRRWQEERRPGDQ